MATKITTNDAAFIVEDTVSGEVLSSTPRTHVWYDEKKLDNEGLVILYDDRPINSSKFINSGGYPIAECVGFNDVAYTAATFRTFMYRNTDQGYVLNPDEAAAMGYIKGVEVWNKFGYNNDVDTGTEVIAAFGGTFTAPTTARTLSIVSSSANDDDEGTGLNSVVLFGIDENRDALVEVVTLNGQTPVTTSNTFLGVNRIAPFLCGAGLVNDGTITATLTTDDILIATMPAGENVTQQCIFYVPSNYTFLTSGLYGSVLKLSGGSSPVVLIKGWVYSPIANSKILVFEDKIDASVENHIRFASDESFPVTEKSVLWFEVTTDQNNTAIDFRFSGKLVINQR